jgi:hypothetical protein
VLRVFRLMRYFKKDYSWDNFRVLVAVFFTGVAYVMQFAILLGLNMYVFAILGMKFFAGRLRFNEDGDVDYLHG